MSSLRYTLNLLFMKSSAVVNGNIHVRKIQVEMGAQINGSFKMISEQEYEQLVATMVHKSSAPAPKPVRVAAPKPQPEPVKPAPQAS